MTLTKKISLALILTGGLAGCQHLSYPIDPDFGVAVKAANDKQIVSKEALTGSPVMDPRMKAAAYQRYLDGKVKQPKNSNSIKAKGNSDKGQ